MKKKSISLSFQLPLIFVVSYIVLGILISIVVYYRFERRMIDEYSRMAEGVTSLMAEAIDTDKIDYYVENNYSSEEYMDILKYYYRLKDSYPDIYYMYVYSFSNESVPAGRVIIDLDEEYTDTPPRDSIDWIGDDYILDEPFASEVSEMTDGAQTRFHAVHTQDEEYLLSYVRPLLDENGNYVTSLCVDFSMDEMHAQDLRFMAGMMSVLGILMLLILYVNILLVRRKVTYPLDSISGCIDGFIFNSAEDRADNVNRLEKLEIESKNEIGKLYKSLLSTMKESMFYMTNLRRAESEIQEISKMTYVDTLTGESNKSAYERDRKQIEDMIGTEDMEFAILMMDVNGLKHVNDTYGHNAGDEYIKGCCGVLRDVFKESRIYRIGGDEFVAILKGSDYINRNNGLKNLNERFASRYADKTLPEKERYTASVGMATYEKGNTIDIVLRHADEEMYASKAEFKRLGGITR